MYSSNVKNTVKLIIVIACGISANAFGWGGDGHKTIGAIADQMLAGSPTSKKLKTLLQPGESLSSISTWADCAKGFTYCQKELTPEQKAFATANPQHHDYHYTDIPIDSVSYSEATYGKTDHDVVQILKESISTLRGNPGTHQFSKREALMLLTHLLGDLHQPLHVGAVYLDANGAIQEPTQPLIDSKKVFATEGGNKLHINGTTRVIHGYWDSDAVKTIMRRKKVIDPAHLATALLDSNSKPLQIKGDLDKAIETWADESLTDSKLAFDGVAIGNHTENYKDSKGGATDGWAITLPTIYPKLASDIASDRLLLAGKRLAAVLAQILK